MRVVTVAVAGLALVAAIALLFWPGKRVLPMIENARALPVAGSQSVMVTLTIRNPGGPDRLIDVTSGVAKTSVLKSPRVQGLPVPADSMSALSAEAGHVMLMRIDGALEPGRTIPLVLRFERAGEVVAKAVVAEGAMAHGVVHETTPGEPAPEVSLSATRDGDGWRLRLEVENFRFARDLADGPHVPGTGHGHLYIGGMKIGRIYGVEARVGALPPGLHLIEVVLYTNDHRAYSVAGRAVHAAVEIGAD